MSAPTISSRRRLVPAEDLELKVRSGDHENSWMAAARMAPPEEKSLKDQLHRILTFDGPLTHDDLVAVYEAEGGSVTPQRVRTACAEMARDRDLRTGRPQKVRVRSTGDSTKSDHNYATQLWDAVNDSDATYDVLDGHGNVLMTVVARDEGVATYRAAQALRYSGYAHVALRLHVDEAARA